MKQTSIALLFGTVLSLVACSTTYRAEPIEAWVVDADTGKPIEGVVVTANWELERGTAGGFVPFGQIMVMETVTDSKGRFYFPAWGPKSTPVYLPIPLIENSPQLVDRDPQILLFKSGYRWRGLENYPLTNYNKGSLHKSDWNGKTIKIEKFKGSLREYADQLTFIRTPLRFVEQDCNWKATPRMILALDQEYRIFQTNGISTALHLISTLEGISQSSGRDCGSAKDFFERARK